MKKALALVGLLIAVAETYAKAQNPVFEPDVNQLYWIKTRLADLRLAAPDREQGAQHIVVNAPRDNDKSQQWKFVKDGNVYHIICAATQYRLDIHGGTKSPNGDQVCQAQPNKTGAQDWIIEATDTDHFAIKSTLAGVEGHYLDVYAGHKKPGSKVCHAFGSNNETAYNNTDSQLWKFIQVPVPLPDPK